MTNKEIVSPGDVLEMADYLGVSPDTEPHLLHIAREALLTDLPPGWKEITDHEGRTVYVFESTNATTFEHPLDTYFVDKLNRERNLWVNRPIPPNAYWMDFTDESGGMYYYNFRTHEATYSQPGETVSLPSVAMPRAPQQAFGSSVTGGGSVGNGVPHQPSVAWASPSTPPSRQSAFTTSSSYSSFAHPPNGLQPSPPSTGGPVQPSPPRLTPPSTGSERSVSPRMQFIVGQHQQPHQGNASYSPAKPSPRTDENLVFNESEGQSTAAFHDHSRDSSMRPQTVSTSFTPTSFQQSMSNLSPRPPQTAAGSLAHTYPPSHAQSSAHVHSPNAHTFNTPQFQQPSQMHSNHIDTNSLSAAGGFSSNPANALSPPGSAQLSPYRPPLPPKSPEKPDTANSATSLDPNVQLSNDVSARLSHSQAVLGSTSSFEAPSGMPPSSPAAAHGASLHSPQTSALQSPQQTARTSVSADGTWSQGLTSDASSSSSAGGAPPRQIRTASGGSAKTDSASESDGSVGKRRGWLGRLQSFVKRDAAIEKVDADWDPRDFDSGLIESDDQIRDIAFDLGLGINDAHLLWLAEDFLMRSSNLPLGWMSRTYGDGSVAYINEETHEETSKHPNFDHYTFAARLLKRCGGIVWDSEGVAASESPAVVRRLRSRVNALEKGLQEKESEVKKVIADMERLQTVNEARAQELAMEALNDVKEVWLEESEAAVSNMRASANEEISRLHANLRQLEDQLHVERISKKTWIKKVISDGAIVAESMDSMTSEIRDVLMSACGNLPIEETLVSSMAGAVAAMVGRDRAELKSAVDKSQQDLDVLQMRLSETEKSLALMTERANAAEIKLNSDVAIPPPPPPSVPGDQHPRPAVAPVLIARSPYPGDEDGSLTPPVSISVSSAGTPVRGGVGVGAGGVCPPPPSVGECYSESLGGVSPSVCDGQCRDIVLKMGADIQKLRGELAAAVAAREAADASLLSKDSELKALLLKATVGAQGGIADDSVTSTDPTKGGVDAGLVVQLREKLRESELEISRLQSLLKAIEDNKDSSSETVRIAEARLSRMEQEVSSHKEASKQKLAQLQSQFDEEKTVLQQYYYKREKEAEQKLKEIEAKLASSVKRETKLEDESKHVRSILKTSQMLLKTLRDELAHIKEDVSVMSVFDVSSLEHILLRAAKSKSEVLADAAEEANAGMAKVLDERRKLLNQLHDLKGNVRVLCRARPLSESEEKKGESCLLEMQPALAQVACPLDVGASGFKMFEFESVFSLRSTQEQVFREVEPLVQSVLDGYNCCIFAYGQTGSGKTHTMIGPANDRGINYRFLRHMFEMSRGGWAGFTYTFSVCLLEIYNEQIRDLLYVPPKNEGPRPELPKWDIKQSADGSVFVSNMTEVPVSGLHDVVQIMHLGFRNRSTGATKANAQSSRSHLVMSVTTRGHNIASGERVFSRLHLVDLAGSERLSKTEAEGERLKEAQHINKSLSALGDVISSLKSGDSAHVPYRNSKLTYLLKDSLGGQSKTVMFVNISPSLSSTPETSCSLQFASRVRSVTLGPAKKNVQATGPEKLALQKMYEQVKDKDKVIQVLTNEVNRLKNEGSGGKSSVKGKIAATLLSEMGNVHVPTSSGVPPPGPTGPRPMPVTPKVHSSSASLSPGPRSANLSSGSPAASPGATPPRGAGLVSKRSSGTPSRSPSTRSPSVGGRSTSGGGNDEVRPTPPSVSPAHARTPSQRKMKSPYR
eukprot:Rmarinus@m.29961